MPDYSEINSENTELLQDIIDDAPSYTKDTNSRNAEILKSIINGTEYDAEPQSEVEELLLQLKEAGVGGGNEIQTPRYIAYKEQSMDIEYSFDKVEISYESGAYIGLSLNGIVDLSGRNFTKIKYDITTEESYDSLNNQNIRPLVIGTTDQVRNTSVYVNQTTVPNYFNAYKIHDVNDVNKHLVGEVDISDVEGTFYFLLVATGWNLTINSLSLE